MRVEVDGEVVLMTGDCGYDNIVGASLQDVTAVTIPHHGGQATSVPPTAKGNAIAIASYGCPNCYRHPDEEFLKQHVTTGWTVKRTAADVSNGGRRGFRTLYKAV